jgi:hypothetical protein
MFTRISWVVVCLCLTIPGSAANANVSQEPQLRKIISADTLAYIRIPNLWGLLSDPKGTIFNDVFKSEEHARLITTVKKSMGERFLHLADSTWSPVIQMFFSELASPIELAVEMPEGQPLQSAALMISATLSSDSLEAFKTFLTDLTENSSHLNLLSDVSPDGHAILTAQTMPVLVHYDPGKKLFRAMTGMAVNEALFKDRLARMTPVQAHPMYPFENEMDESRQGFFAWLHAAKMIPTIKASMPPGDLEIMEKLGLASIRSIALGWGVSQGKGHLGLMIDAPKAGYRRLFPDIQNRFSLWASGIPESVATISLPLKEITRVLKTLSEEETIPAVQLLQEVDSACRNHVNMPLDNVLDAFGSEMILFRDEIDTFFALEIGNRMELDRLLTNISNHTDSSLVVHEKEGKQYWHLRLPSIFSMAGEKETTSSSEGTALGILEAIKTHLFWTEDGDYLVFASAPQALFDRASFLERVPIKSWIDETRDAQHAVVSLSTRLPGVPSKVYYGYLRFLCLLGDIAAHPIDLFSLPSVREADLPLEGAYGFRLDWSDPVVSLSLTFENNPMEFLLRQNASTVVAGAGILAAVAIPKFMDYRTRAYDATANAAIKNAYTAAQAYFNTYPGETVTIENLEQMGYRPTDGVVLTIEDGTRNSLRMIAHHEGGKTVYLIDSKGNIEKSAR